MATSIKNIWNAVWYNSVETGVSSSLPVGLLQRPERFVFYCVCNILFSGYDAFLKYGSYQWSNGLIPLNV